MLHNACHVTVVDGRRGRRAPPARCQQSGWIVANRQCPTVISTLRRASAGGSGCGVRGCV